MPTEDFDSYFAQQYPKLVAELDFILGDTDLARDIAQDAFVTQYISWARLRRYDKPGAWVRRVALRVAFKTRRRLLRLTSHDDAKLDNDPAYATELFNPTASTSVFTTRYDNSGRLWSHTVRNTEGQPELDETEVQVGTTQKILSNQSIETRDQGLFYQENSAVGPVSFYSPTLDSSRLFAQLSTGKNATLRSTVLNNADVWQIDVDADLLGEHSSRTSNRGT